METVKLTREQIALRDASTAAWIATLQAQARDESDPEVRDCARAVLARRGGIGAAGMTTASCPVAQLEPGDEYIIGLVGGRRASRTVLGILQRTAFGGALLEVRDDSGNVFRSHMQGSVDRILRTVRVLGVVDPLGYLRCAQCVDIQSPEYIDATRYVWSDSEPHRSEPCDSCGTVLAEVVWP